MHYGASELIFKRAEELRKFPTHAEVVIWGHLKGNSLHVKFRRQHPLFLYIADFYCHSLKLVIEVDGSIHNKNEHKINDAIRQGHIESFGIAVIRVKNEEVLLRPEHVLLRISEQIQKRRLELNIG